MSQQQLRQQQRHAAVYIYIYKRQVLWQKLDNGFAAGDERWPAHSVTPADENRLCLMSIRALC